MPAIDSEVKDLPDLHNTATTAAQQRSWLVGTMGKRELESARARCTAQCAGVGVKQNCKVFTCSRKPAWTRVKDSACSSTRLSRSEAS
jgi:hypothetical protein